MHNKSQFRDEVMSRVKTVGAVRMVIRSPFLGALFVAGLLTWMTIVVSFQHVIRNAMTHEHWTGSVSYIYNSLIHTRAIVQILAGCMLVGCGILSFHFLRMCKNTGILSKIFFFRRAI